MNSRFLKGLWLLLAIGAVVFGVMAAPTATATVTDENNVTQTVISPTLWIYPVVAYIMIHTLVTVFSVTRPPLLRRVLGWLRERPILYWFLLLVYLCVAVGWWVYKEQPTNGRGLTAVEFCYLCCISWGFIGLIAYDMNTPRLRAMGSKLGKSKLTGVLVTLTTILIIFWAAEAYLRVYYITTDGYGFTAMNYHWYKNFYWGHYNSLGYRDYEPLPDDPANPVTRIAIVGDSFTAGHGISNIDDMYAEVLEKKLGPGYDVNLVAQSGWDTDVETGYLNAYYENIKPRKPQYVVLAYYLNDVDYILFRDQETNPNSVFNFLDLSTPGGWFVLNFFVPNYIYYNIAQFTRQDKNTNFTDKLITAHLDDKVWAEQEVNLGNFYQWTQDHDAKLIVLLWPQMAAVKESQPALQRVRDYFKDKANVQIADMSPLIEGKPTLDMIVNRFDSHPSVEANRLAAELLYEVITGKTG